MFRCFVVGRSNLDHIEAKRPRLLPQAREVGLDGTAKDALFARVDRIKTRHERANRAGLHLDKHERLTVATDQVDFITAILRIAPVARDNLEAALAGEPCCRGFFAAFTRSRRRMEPE